MPALLVHGTLDETVSIELSRNYARAARAAGGEVELVEIPGGPGATARTSIPRGAAWAAVTRRLPTLGEDSRRATRADRAAVPHKTSRRAWL